MGKIKNFISEKINILRKNKIKYKFIAYISEDEHDGLVSGKGIVVDAFEIEDYSERLAYREAIDAMNLKYDKKGLYIRITK